MASSSEKHNQIAMVMVPFLAHGHLNQLLHLSRLLSPYDIPIHFVGFSTEITQAKARIHGWDLPNNIIHFHEFPTNNSSNDNTSQTISRFIASIVDASLQLRDPLKEFINTLSSTTRKVVIIYDALMATSVQDVVSIKNVESYCFYAASAFTVNSMFFDLVQNRLHIPSFFMKLAKTLLLPSSVYIPQGLPSLESCFPPEFLKFIQLQFDVNKFSSGDLYDTCKVFEGPYLETLARFNKLLRNSPQWALGPFNPVTMSSGITDSKSRHKCLDWLDKQEPHSVILVSFGTTGYLSVEQVEELAVGLEKSKQNFVWVVRDSLSGEAQLPKGYEDRVKDRGIIVRDWAPQLDILAHKSTGGFMSHCGWNSCMESITMGVPIATWPLQFDQPRNAFLVTDVLKIGVVVKKWENRDDIINSSTIKHAVDKLMTSKEGHEMRMRAIELGKKVRESAKDGGDQQKQMDSFIAHVTRH